MPRRQLWQFNQIVGVLILRTAKVIRGFCQIGGKHVKGWMCMRDASRACGNKKVCERTILGNKGSGRKDVFFSQGMRNRSFILTVELIRAAPEGYCIWRAAGYRL
jgi:hypothetical protein